MVSRRSAVPVVALMPGLSAMGEDVDFGPAQQIELDPRREEIEAAFGQRQTAFPAQHAIEMALEIMQVEHVGSGVFELRLGDSFGAPVRALLLLRHIDVEQ